MMLRRTDSNNLLALALPLVHINHARIHSSDELCDLSPLYPFTHSLHRIVAVVVYVVYVNIAGNILKKKTPASRFGVLAVSSIMLCRSLGGLNFRNNTILPEF